MGPRLCSRGEQPAHDHLHVHGRVAMGPRLCSRGEGASVMEGHRRPSSQWGHGFVAVESGTSMPARGA